MKLKDSIRWKMENELQCSLTNDAQEMDEITCKRYWIYAKFSKKNWLVWEFSDGLIAIVPEGGLLSRKMIHISGERRMSPDLSKAKPYDTLILRQHHLILVPEYDWDYYKKKAEKWEGVARYAIGLTTAKNGLYTGQQIREIGKTLLDILKGKFTVCY